MESREGTDGWRENNRLIYRNDGEPSDGNEIISFDCLDGFAAEKKTNAPPLPSPLYNWYWKFLLDFEAIGGRKRKSGYDVMSARSSKTTNQLAGCTWTEEDLALMMFRWGACKLADGLILGHGKVQNLHNIAINWQGGVEADKDREKDKSLDCIYDGVESNRHDSDVVDLRTYLFSCTAVRAALSACGETPGNYYYYYMRGG